MTSPTATRVNWLLPDETREVYRVYRGVRAPTDLPRPGGHSLASRADTQACLRCGGRIIDIGTGARAALTALVRARGTKCTDVTVQVIHRGCIPRPTEEPQRIRARALRATQLRA